MNADRPLPKGWRPLPGSDGGPRRVGVSLDAVTSRLGTAPAASLGAVFGGWDRAVGETVAAACRPVSLVDGVLVVATAEPAWAAQLPWLAPDLLRRLNEAAGEPVVERLEVRVDGQRRARQPKRAR